MTFSRDVRSVHICETVQWNQKNIQKDWTWNLKNLSKGKQNWTWNLKNPSKEHIMECRIWKNPQNENSTTHRTFVLIPLLFFSCLSVCTTRMCFFFYILSSTFKKCIFFSFFFIPSYYYFSYLIALKCILCESPLSHGLVYLQKTWFKSGVILDHIIINANINKCDHIILCQSFKCISG